MDDNKNKPMGWPILYTLATLAGVAVLAILKACGIISMSWPVVIAGLVGTHCTAADHSLGGHAPDLDRANREKDQGIQSQEKDLPHSGRIHDRAHAEQRRPHLWY